MFDLRLLGFAREMRVTAAARHLLGWSRRSLLLVIPTGLLLFMANATETWANPAFRLKLLLLAAAGTNALVFHLRNSLTMSEWDALLSPPLNARISAVVSLLCWAGVITCGRLIAYL